MQVIRPLPHNTSLKMTTSKYFTPSGRSIQALDYGRHDGTAEAIPDSLRRPFQTRAGRTVYDGRGIEPDVTAGWGEPSDLEEALLRRAAFFFFANHYVAQHPLGPAAEAAFAQGVDPDFDLGAMLDAFEAWLDTQDFTYRTSAERAVEELSEDLVAMGYGETSDEVAELRRAVLAEKAADFDRYAERLQARLRTEVMARYLGETAQIKAALAYDPQLDEALALLKNERAYADLLRP